MSDPRQNQSATQAPKVCARYYTKPPVVVLKATVIVGGQTSSTSIENKPRSNWSFEVDWEHHVVWISCEIQRGRIATAWTPFTNVLSCGMPIVETESATAGAAA